MLIEMSVKVREEPVGLHSRQCGGSPEQSRRGHESAALDRTQLSSRHAVAGHDERFAGVERAHDLAAIVAQFPLRDGSCHGSRVARVLWRHKRLNGDEIVSSALDDAAAPEQADDGRHQGGMLRRTARHGENPTVQILVLRIASSKRRYSS